MSTKRKKINEIFRALQMDLISMSEYTAANFIKQAGWFQDDAIENSNDAWEYIQGAYTAMTAASAAVPKSVMKGDISPTKAEAVQAEFAKLELAIKKIYDDFQSFVLALGTATQNSDVYFWPREGIAVLQRTYKDIASIADAAKKSKLTEDSSWLWDTAEKDLVDPVLSKLSDANDEIENALSNLDQKVGGPLPPQPAAAQLAPAQDASAAKASYVAFVKDVINYWNKIKADPEKKKVANAYFASDTWQAIKRLDPAVKSGKFNPQEVSAAVDAAKKQLAQLKN